MITRNIIMRDLGLIWATMGHQLQEEVER